jgi:hypothetical protein
LLLSAAPVLAQPAKPPATEHHRHQPGASPQVVDRFIEAFAAPTYTLGKMSDGTPASARWRLD